MWTSGPVRPLVVLAAASRRCRWRRPRGLGAGSGRRLVLHEFERIRGLLHLVEGVKELAGLLALRGPLLVDQLSEEVGLGHAVGGGDDVEAALVDDREAIQVVHLVLEDRFGEVACRFGVECASPLGQLGHDLARPVDAAGLVHEGARLQLGGEEAVLGRVHDAHALFILMVYFVQYSGKGVALVTFVVAFEGVEAPRRGGFGQADTLGVALHVLVPWARRLSAGWCKRSVSLFSRSLARTQARDQPLQPLDLLLLHVVRGAHIDNFGFGGPRRAAGGHGGDSRGPQPLLLLLHLRGELRLEPQSLPALSGRRSPPFLVVVGGKFALVRVGVTFARARGVFLPPRARQGLVGLGRRLCQRRRRRRGLVGCSFGALRCVGGLLLGASVRLPLGRGFGGCKRLRSVLEGLLRLFWAKAPEEILDGGLGWWPGRRSLYTAASLRHDPS